jgi:hypothetical protein
MQLKLGIETPQKTTSRYSVVALCNKCGGMHEMGVSITLREGPSTRQSICAAYKDRSVPPNVASLANVSATCPATGRGFTQKDNQQIFLVPAEN